MTQFTQEYDNAIKQLAQQFQKKSLSYFSECELQYDLYCIFKASRLINGSAVTHNGVNIGTIHPEYPSVNRVQLQNGKGYRVWFDLAILNPEFIKANDYKAVWARDERSTKFWGDNILAAFEFKYFPTIRTHNLSLVQQDCVKLSSCPEIAHRYVLVFSGYEIDASTLNGIDPGTSRLIWVTPQAEYVLDPQSKQTY